MNAEPTDYDVYVALYETTRDGTRREVVRKTIGLRFADQRIELISPLEHVTSTDAPTLTHVAMLDGFNSDWGKPHAVFRIDGKRLIAEPGATATLLAELDARAVALYVARYTIERMCDLFEANVQGGTSLRWLPPEQTKTYANVLGLIAYARGEQQIAIPVREAADQILCGLKPPPAPRDAAKVLPEWLLVIEAAEAREAAEDAAPATPARTLPYVEPRYMSREEWEKEGNDDG